jgi:hypothetical protein
VAVAREPAPKRPFTCTAGIRGRSALAGSDPCQGRNRLHLGDAAKLVRQLGAWRGRGVMVYFHSGWKASPWMLSAAIFGVADFDAFLVCVGVEFAADGQTLLGRGRRDQFDDRRPTGERATAPILCDGAEQAMFDLVPLRCAGRIVADADGQSGLVSEFCSSTFHSRTREPLEPPPSAVIINRSARG